MAHMPPRPRTSPTSGHFFCQPRARNSKCFPRAVDRASRPSFSIVSIAASAAAHEAGCPQKVPPSAPTPGASMISARPVTAAMGMPPPRDFAMVIKSGSMPKCSEANHLPVRAKPDCTSSAMKRMPCLRQIFFKLLHNICRKHGILFIADEVQSGFARTGKWFASEHFGIEPDLITMAKSLGGGMPIAAVTGRAEIMDAPGVGSLGGTYCGHPASCAAALAAIETIEKDGLLARSAAIGRRFEERARAWQKKWPLIGDVRGLGGMCAMELVRDPASREPADTETKQIARFCYEHGLITITAGTFNNVLRSLVPLVVADEQFDEGLGVIEAALAAVAEQKQAALSHA